MKQSIFTSQFKNHFIALLSVVFLFTQIFALLHQNSHNLKSDSEYSFENDYSKNLHSTPKKNHSNHQCLICSLVHFFKFSFTKALILNLFNAITFIFFLKKFQGFLKSPIASNNLSRAPPKLV